MNRAMVITLALALSGGWAAAAGAEFDGFPFSIPFEGLKAGTAPADLAGPDAPAGAGGFVQVEGDRFVPSEGGVPVRFWGTNLCFAGCFPPHDVADRMARRLATLGVNCVRFHHMDASGYPRGIWRNEGWGDFEHTDLHPDALDRLDYLVARLRENGVYTNLNLHVSRTYGPADGFPAVGEGEAVSNYGKGVDHFFPRCIDEQKRYARMLLRHVNAYTGRPYAEEPAVAIVEVSNEDGLVHTWARGGLDRVPRAYADELQAQWNRWLARQYGSTGKLRSAWAEGARGQEGPDLLAGPSVRDGLETHEQAQATEQQTRTPDGQPASLIKVLRASPTSWHVQRSWSSVAVERGTTYVLRVRLRTNRPDTVSLNCTMAHDPWRHLGLTSSVDVGTDWRAYELYFTAQEDDAPDEEGRGGARITLSGLSKDGLEVAFTRPTLCVAAITGLPAGEALEAADVAWPRRQLDGRSPPVQRDVVRFLRDTEAAYWRGMCEYIHDELGAKMAVTGTAVGFTTAFVAAETVDFVDAHAYWRHPSFPGRPWDPGNWIVRSDPMVNSPATSTIRSLAGRRVFGLPFTVTEYNHPSPHLYEAEGFPVIAACGSHQAWDGVFGFAYCHSDRWETDHFESFFDVAGNPVKLALQPACSAILCRGAVGSPARTAPAQIPLARRLELLAGGPWGVDAYAGGVADLAWLDALVGVVAGHGQPAPGKGDGALQWDVREGRGALTFTGRDCMGLVGFCEGRELDAGAVSITPGRTSLDGFSVLMVNAVDGQPLGSAGRHLVTAVTRCANRDMGWNADRTSVGRQWGTGPTLCEGVPFSLAVRGAAELFALAPDGTRREQVQPGATTGGLSVFAPGPAWRTLWYELVVSE